MSACRRAAARPRTCVVAPNQASYSESFIKAHVAGLPADRALYGGWFPRWRDDGGLLAPPPLGAARAHADRLPSALRRGVLAATDLALLRFLRSARVEVLLAEYGPTGAELLRACRWAGVPLVVHFHGADAFHGPTLAAYAGRYRPMLAAAAAVIAVSRPMERALLELGAPRERLHYLPYGVDTERFTVGDPAAAPPHFLAVGRFVEKKGPHLTLLAFARVHAGRPEARLTMAGDGPLLAPCRQLAAALGLADAVSFVGPQPHAEVARLMAGARAFVQHSLRASDGDSEGTPVVILEAGAAGLSVVATRHAGIPEAVVDGETGLLVGEGDVEEMAAHMLALVDTPALAARLGLRARAHIEANYSLPENLVRLGAILAAAAGGRAP